MIGSICTIRAVKSYPEAHTHLLVGEVLSSDDVAISLRCRTFHFGRVVNGPKDVKQGAANKRVIPWSRIEIINELPGNFNFVDAQLNVDKNGTVILAQGDYLCEIVLAKGPRF